MSDIRRPIKLSIARRRATDGTMAAAYRRARLRPRLPPPLPPLASLALLLRGRNHPRGETEDPSDEDTFGKKKTGTRISLSLLFMYSLYLSYICNSLSFLFTSLSLSSLPLFLSLFPHTHTLCVCGSEHRRALQHICSPCGGAMEIYAAFILNSSLNFLYLAALLCICGHPPVTASTDRQMEGDPGFHKENVSRGDKGNERRGEGVMMNGASS